MKGTIKGKVTPYLLSLLISVGLQACGVKGSPLPPLKPAPLSDPYNQKPPPKKSNQTKQADDQKH